MFNTYSKHFYFNTHFHIDCGSTTVKAYLNSNHRRRPSHYFRVYGRTKRFKATTHARGSSEIKIIYISPLKTDKRGILIVCIFCFLLK